MLSRDGKAVENSKPAGAVAGLNVELRADAADDLRAPSFGGQHSGKEEKLSGSDGFDIVTEGLRRSRQGQAKLPQTGFGAYRRRLLFLVL
jgi:hypothetical protein